MNVLSFILLLFDGSLDCFVSALPKNLADTKLFV